MNSKFVTLDKIKKAGEIIKNKLHRTPVCTSTSIGNMFDIKLYLKLELFQKTGSFKPRGVMTKLHHLTTQEKKRGVISLSAGNHAQALAWSATSEGIESTIIMPADAYQNKIEATKNYGGQVILTEESLLDTCLSVKEEKNLTLIHPFDDIDVISGQGTVGLEIMEDIPDLDVILVAIGGGGLISGIAAAAKQIKPEIKIFGIEPEGSNVMTQSLEAGYPVNLHKNKTIADGLSAPFAGVHTLRHVQRFVDEIICVPDSEIIESMKLLMERVKILPEPSGAACLTALQFGHAEIETHSRVMCVICGGNISWDGLKSLGEKEANFKE